MWLLKEADGNMYDLLDFEKGEIDGTRLTGAFGNK